MNSKKFVAIVMLISCLQSMAQAIDVDGNNYDTSETEGIVYMTRNLNVSKFRNGDEIKQAQTNEEWIQADKNEEPAWCYYNNDEENGKTFGKLYNGYAVIDSRGLAPEGWHIPKMKEWKEIIEGFGGKKQAGKMMKNDSGWIENGNGSAEGSFKGLPAGIRGYDGSFLSEGKTGSWWSSSAANAYTNSYILLYSSSDKVERASALYVQGKSVRCIKS